MSSRPALLRVIPWHVPDDLSIEEAVAGRMRRDHDLLSRLVGVLAEPPRREFSAKSCDRSAEDRGPRHEGQDGRGVAWHQSLAAKRFGPTGGGMEGYSTVDAQFENAQQLQSARHPLAREGRAQGSWRRGWQRCRLAQGRNRPPDPHQCRSRNRERSAEGRDRNGKGQEHCCPEAKPRGAGSYSNMEGDTEVREKLTKDQAEAFNALNAAGKTKWLADNPKPA